MPAVVIQRYLLVAQSASTSIPASAVQQGSAISATVPLSGAWTVRVRHCEALIQANDNSGSIQLLNVAAAYTFINQQGVNQFSMTANGPTWITPPVAMPAFNGAVLSNSFDFDQTISSLDQVGGTITGVFAAANIAVHNTDAANPHPATFFIRSIIEFEKAGTSE